MSEIKAIEKLREIAELQAELYELRKTTPQGQDGNLDQSQVDWLRLMPMGWNGNDVIAELQEKADVLKAERDVFRDDALVLKSKVDALEAEVAEKYMPLPLDADGVPIFIGDLLKSDETNEQFMCRGYSVTLQPSDNCKWWTVECSYDSYSGTSEYVSAKSCHHVKPRTIEDVLVRFLSSCGDDDPHFYDEEIREYADELRNMLGSGEQ